MMFALPMTRSHLVTLKMNPVFLKYTPKMESWSKIFTMSFFKDFYRSSPSSVIKAFITKKSLIPIERLNTVTPRDIKTKVYLMKDSRSRQNRAKNLNDWIVNKMEAILWIAIKMTEIISQTSRSLLPISLPLSGF